MTISPPSKVNLNNSEPVRVLASGIDTLNLSLQVHWDGETFLKVLQEFQVTAAREETACPYALKSGDGQDTWIGNIQPYGSKGYAYILQSNELTMKIGHWVKPKQRPSVLVELRSECLWRVGARAAVGRVVELITATGATVQTVKASRVDLCVDVLVPESVWSMELKPLMVTRAVKISQHFKHELLTGFSIGAGQISARLYDKPLEITSQSHKTWMYDIWGIPEVPPGCRIIRVEFQLRREVLKHSGIETVDNLFRMEGNLWAYCTQNWLKIEHNPGKHHTQREVLPWWVVVQSGYAGAQNATPTIRAKAMSAERKQLLQQIGGLLVSLTALPLQAYDLEDGSEFSVERQFCDVLDGLEEIGLCDEVFTNRVRDRLADYQRRQRKSELASAVRTQYGNV